MALCPVVVERSPTTIAMTRGADHVLILANPARAIRPVNERLVTANVSP